MGLIIIQDGTIVSSASLPEHNSDKHVGSAKRDAASGVAGLDASSKIFTRLSYEDVASGVVTFDASGNVLVKGNIIRINGSGSLHTYLKSRATSEEMVHIQKIAPNDYIMQHKVSNVWKTVLHEGDVGVASGVAGLDASGNVSGLFLSVSDFQTNVATGTASSPARLNDASLAADVGFTINEYVDVVFPKKSFISEYRHHGSADMTGDGTYKIQHWDGSGWVDNTTGISTRGNTWSPWIMLAGPIFTEKIRIVATVIDTYTENQIYELEMKG